MRLSLRDTQLKALGELDETGILPRVDIDADRHIFSSSISVDLSRFDDEILQKLSKFLRASKVRGTLTMSEDIDMFLALRNTEDKFGIKMRKVEFFKAYLTEALRDSERHRLYRFDPARNVWFAYFVYGISCHPTVTREGWTDPEHVVISLGWVELGEDCAETVRFDAQHIVGKTVRDALQTRGFHLETSSLYEGYLQAESKFDNLCDQIGLQVLATGIGTNDVDDDRSWWRASTPNGNLALFAS